MATKVCERCGRLTACSVPDCPLNSKKSMEQQGGQEEIMQLVSILYDAEGNPTGSEEAAAAAESLGVSLEQLYQQFPTADAFMQYIQQMQGGGGEQAPAPEQAPEEAPMMKMGGKAGFVKGEKADDKKKKMPPNKVYENGGKIQKDWSWNF